MKEIALNILDIAENSFFAGATKTEIIVEETDKRLILTVTDDGCGMDEETLLNAPDPFFSKKGKIGLGLAMLKAEAERTKGGFSLSSQNGKKHFTCVTAVFVKTHIDCPPLGDIISTLVALSVRDKRIIFTHSYGAAKVKADTENFTDEISGKTDIIAVKNSLRKQYAEFYSYMKGPVL